MGTRALGASVTGLAFRAILPLRRRCMARKVQAPPMRASSVRHGCHLIRVRATLRRPPLGLEGPKADVYYKFKLESTPIFVLVFSRSLPCATLCVHGSTLPFSCASMIFDDCLMIISPHLFHEYCLPLTSIFHNKSQPTSSFYRQLLRYFPLCCLVSRSSISSPPFSSQLGLQLDLLSCSSVSVRD